MNSSQIRANARESLKGKWGKAALLILVYSLIVWVISWVCNLIPVIGPIANFILSGTISYGILVSFVKLKRGEEVGYVDFLTLSFKSFSKIWAVYGNTILKMIIPVALLIVFVVVFTFGTAGSVTGILAGSSSVTAGFSGVAIIGFIGYVASLIYVIVKGYLYSLTLYILYDNENMTGKEIVEESEKLMKGNRWSFFWLSLTFIGWAILATFTFGIGFLWLIPYIGVAQVCFYEALAKKSEPEVVETQE